GVVQRAGQLDRRRVDHDDVVDRVAARQAVDTGPAAVAVEDGLAGDESMLAAQVDTVAAHIDGGGVEEVCRDAGVGDVGLGHLADDADIDAGPDAGDPRAGAGAGSADDARVVGRVDVDALAGVGEDGLDVDLGAPADIGPARLVQHLNRRAA